MKLTPPEIFHDFSVRPTNGPDEILACEEAKTRIINVMRHPGVPPKLYLAGPSGSGKSSLIKSVIRLVACESPSGLSPCQTCKGCRAFRSTSDKRTTGLFSEFTYFDCKRPIDYLAINCRSCSLSEMEDHLLSLRGRQHALRIIHFEEAVSLYRDRRDELLTDIMDDPDLNTCRWFATSVCNHGLDEQFRRRWNVPVTSTPPSTKALAEALSRSCGELGIRIDHPSTWKLLAKSSWGVVGLAYALIGTALMDEPPALTRKMVLDHPFPTENPWEREFFQR